MVKGHERPRCRPLLAQMPREPFVLLGVTAFLDPAIAVEADYMAIGEVEAEEALVSRQRHVGEIVLRVLLVVADGADPGHGMAQRIERLEELGPPGVVILAV